MLAAGIVGLASMPAGASSHREAPLIAGDPPVDNTDVYAFVSPDSPDTVTLVANWYPFQEPNGGPNFYPWATDANYDINIDNDGDAKPDLTYRWTFTTDDRRRNATFLYNNGQVTSLEDENLLFRQNYKLEVIDDEGRSTTLVKSAPVAPSNTGPASMPDYGKLRDEAIVPAGYGGKSFAGQADDPFFLDLRVFDLLYGGDLSETGQDTLAGYNVNTVALQLPTSAVVLNGDAERNPNIGVWSDTERKTLTLRNSGTQREGGPDVQVSRLGNPLVNEVVVPAGMKDGFNAQEPEDDRRDSALIQKVRDPEVPKLIEAIYGLKAPEAPRADLEEIFLTGITTKSGKEIDVDLNSQLNNKDVDPRRFAPSEQLRLNTGIKPTQEPSRLGVLGGDLQGFPNGRRLIDDVVDIEIQALEGAVRTGKIVEPLAAGDKVDANDRSFGSTFPYVALPHNKSVNTRPSGGSSATAGVPGSDGGNPAALAGLTALGGLAGGLLIGSGVWMLRRKPAVVRSAS